MLCMIKEDSPVREDDVSFLTSLAVWIRGHVPSGQDAFLWLRFWHQTMSIHVARDLYNVFPHACLLVRQQRRWTSWVGALAGTPVFQCFRSDKNHTRTMCVLNPR